MENPSKGARSTGIHTYQLWLAFQMLVWKPHVTLHSVNDTTCFDQMCGARVYAAVPRPHLSSLSVLCSTCHVVV